MKGFFSIFLYTVIVHLRATTSYIYFVLGRDKAMSNFIYYV